MIIKEDFCLAPFNTFGIEALAYELSIITSINELKELYVAGELSKKLLILSKGSNILLTGHFKGLVLLNQIWGKEIAKEDDNHVYLNVSSGEFWPSLVEYTVDNGWGGLENLTDIPGKMGAAPIQNIGAYGAELRDVFVSLEAFDLTNGKLVTFNKEECEFDYRTSIFKSKFKNRYFITSVLIKLTKSPIINLSYKPLADAFKDRNIEEVTISDVSKKVAEIRESKLPNPDKLKNAGSFFKNPIIEMDKYHDLKLEYDNIPSYALKNSTYKIPAAWLIEQCGWKGKRVGNVGVHEKQALVIVKYDTATGFQILDLANSVKKSVFDKFGIDLEFEVNVV
ncbi:MAG: UDP-N-acetylmuramate dehydrogenase [Bacteroidetes bacterium]|nr:UDP-N-acetylmuramate dehydrogenase [Bacteroidota bacterium]